jgi:hypothetical protein
MLLVAWIILAGAVFVVSLATHFSTFAPIDPLDVVPYLMFVHVAIFPPFGAAIWYAKGVGGGRKEGFSVVKHAPMWLRILTVALVVYAFANFPLMLIRNEGGNPDKRGSQYLLTSHGKVLRELSEDEYHGKRAYLVRGVSGHWMLFSSGALTLLVGASRMRRQLGDNPATHETTRQVGPVDG